MEANKIVFQLHHNGFSVIPSGRGKSGKQPLASWKKYQEQQPTKEELCRWMDSLKATKWGIVTNKNVTVIDADTLEARAKLEGMIGQPNVTTPRGGAHWYIDTTGHPTKTRTACMPGVDVRGVGGFVNIVGKGYTILALPAPGALIPYEALPDEIKEALKGKSVANTAMAKVGAAIPVGQRNSELFLLACKMHFSGMTEAAIKAALLEENRLRCAESLLEDEIQNIVKGATRYNIAFEFNQTDSGNARFFASLYGDQLRYNHSNKRWLLWDKHYWKPDRDGYVNRLVGNAAKIQQVAVLNIQDDDKKRRASSWAQRSEDRNRIEACIAIAKTTEPITDDGKNWDSDPMLLGCENGVVDLRTGKLRDGKPEDRITMSTGLRFDPDAKCPRWERFLKEIFSDDDGVADEEFIDWVHRALGYSITGDMREQVFFVCYGEGANGKTTFFNAIHFALGVYACVSPFSTFSKQAYSSSTNDMRALEKMRFITSSETNEGSVFNLERIKALSGGDPITARFLYEEFTTFMPTGKIWLFVNHKPQINDDTVATWRRIRPIPFTKTFIKKDADNQLGEKLRDEAQGILAWLVRGCVRWQEHANKQEAKQGLSPAPECVRASAKEYRQENDSVATFIDECCVIGEGEQTRARSLYHAYKGWAKDAIEKDRILTETAFGKRLKKMIETTKMFTKKEANSGIVYLGIGLNKDGRIIVDLTD